jgi:hypothetical protein
MRETKIKPQMIKCPQCGGLGWIHVYSLLAKNPCPLCKKEGEVTMKQHNKYKTCSNCLWPECSQCNR